MNLKSFMGKIKEKNDKKGYKKSMRLDSNQRPLRPEQIHAYIAYIFNNPSEYRNR